MPSGEKKRILNCKTQKFHSSPVFHRTLYQLCIDFSLGISIKTDEFNFEWGHIPIQLQQRIAQMYPFFFFFSFFYTKCVTLAKAPRILTRRKWVHGNILLSRQMDKRFGFKFKSTRSIAT